MPCKKIKLHTQLNSLCVLDFFLAGQNKKGFFLGILHCHCSPPFLRDLQTMCNAIQALAGFIKSLAAGL